MYANLLITRLDLAGNETGRHCAWKLERLRGRMIIYLDDPESESEHPSPAGELVLGPLESFRVEASW